MPETQTTPWNDAGEMNLAEVDENAGSELLAKGTYSAYVDEADLTKNSKGDPMVKLKFKLDNNEDQSVNGRALFNNYTLTSEFGVKLLKKTCLALKPDLDLASFKPANVEIYFVGNYCTLKVGSQKRKDTGEWRNIIVDVLPEAGKSFWDG